MKEPPYQARSISNDSRACKKATLRIISAYDYRQRANCWQSAFAHLSATWHPNTPGRQCTAPPDLFRENQVWGKQPPAKDLQYHLSRLALERRGDRLHTDL